MLLSQDQLVGLSVDEKLQLIELIWENVRSSGQTPRLSPAQIKELDRRRAEMQAHPEIGLSWDEVRTSIEGGLDAPEA